ncbi:MAG: SRPBCC domain-containing protein [Chloroflexota bacterium]
MSRETKHTLHMTRIFDAPRPVVFDYFTQPELVKTWWVPPGTTAESVEIDLRVGGSCRWQVRGSKNQRIVITGTIKELIIPQRIVMTNQWEGLDATLITFEFIELGKQTEVRLIHHGIPAADMMPMFQTNWTKTLERLEEQLQSRGAL